MNKIIIFGTGERCIRFIENGITEEFEVVAFCDNDAKKWGTLLNDIEVIEPDTINEKEFDFVYISTEEYYDEIKEQLINRLGIQPEIIRAFETNKYDGELWFWKQQFRKEGGRFNNRHYKKFMLDIAQETDDRFLEGKVVADFGCGPRGSLMWTDKPMIKLGIDVLAGMYLENFGDELIKHNMVYVTSSENRIPIPDLFVDYLITVNSLDHVKNLEQMIQELLRILKPGGTLLASFNLNEPKTECEPQTLTEEIIRNQILCHFEVKSFRMAYKNEENAYLNILNGNLVNSIEDNRAGVLWVRAVRK